MNIYFSNANIILLDCAEGTMGQIRQFYGDQSDEILSRIRFVYISHMHADHLGGLYGLIHQRRRAFENLGHKFEKLILLCPNKYVDVGRKQWNYFSHEYFFDDDVHVVFNRTLTNGLPTLTNIGGENTKEEIFLFDQFKAIGLHGVRTVLVEHIYDAHALVLRHIDGWSVAFSGDCKQSNDFIQAGRECSLLGF
jgi:ribonuclease Z